MPPKILHLISQRQGWTGSGVILDSMVGHAGRARWKQAVVLGSPSDDPLPEVGGLKADSIHPLLFESGELNYPLPGMSDVMPYPSTRFSSMDSGMLDRYRRAWRAHLSNVIENFQPDLIHSHHLWILSSMVKDVAPEIPLVIQCHATGLRQMELCPHLADEVKSGCARADRFQVLSTEHAHRLSSNLGQDLDHIHVLPSGYREDYFNRRGRSGDNSRRILYVGKLSHAKGLPWLLDAFDRLRMDHPAIELHVAGSGAGPESEILKKRLRRMRATVYHGVVDQASLGALMRKSEICILPSFYEGVPMVLVEALACGCKLVSTDLPGLRDSIAPTAGGALTTIQLPRLSDVDKPVGEDLPQFVENIARGISRALDNSVPAPVDLTEFGGTIAFKKTAAIWRELLS
jgi:glycosyltransferase involved in cell wall biosynthesis